MPVHSDAEAQAPTAKYPRTPYWPYSPGIGRSGLVHADPQRFVGTPVVITEKLDGGNTLLHQRRVYARSTALPSAAKWMAMVRKHHAWKVTEPGVHLYGEDIFAVHSIAYGPVREDETFRAFALRDAAGVFASFDALEDYAAEKRIPVVPVLFRGCFRTLAELREFVAQAHLGASALGGEREGVVLRLSCGFPASAFRASICKSVRRDHVQSDAHWTRNWQPCRIYAAAE